MHHSSHPTDYKGFDAFVAVGKGAGGGVQSGLNERIEVTAGDTLMSLKRKRNEGTCEFEGCVEETNLEWHHHFKTMPAERRWEGRVGGDMYRKISTFTPTKNKYKQEAYANQLQKCTLLCHTHHTHTHTHHSSSSILNNPLVQQREQESALLVQQHGWEVAMKVMRELRKLGQVL